MLDIIIMDNIIIHCYNYCLCCYSKFICYYLFIKCFVFFMPWQLPFPFSIVQLLALLTAQQELLKIYVSICISYMPYSRISQIKKVFNLANAIQRHF